MSDRDPMPTPVLGGRRVTLRPHTMDDLAAVLERCVDPQTVRWTTVPSPYTGEMARDYLRGCVAGSPDEASWAIELEGRYAGTVDLRSFGCARDHGAGNVGFVTHPWARGRRLMSEAVDLVLDHAFGQLGWELVVWQANVGNVASYKAVWRVGFPLPVAVPALLNHRGRMRDGWHSVTGPDLPREPVVPWDEAYAVLRAQLAASRRPG